MTNLRCRPSENEKEPLIVFLSSTQLLNLKLKPGDLCKVSKTNASPEDVPTQAIAWSTARSDVKDGVVGISKWLQDRAGIKLGNDVIIQKSDSVLQETELVYLRPVERSTLGQLTPWQGAATISIREGVKFLSVGQVITVSVGKSRRDFEVAQQGGEDIFKIGSSTSARLETEEGVKSPPRAVNSRGVAIRRPVFENIGGLKDQIAKIREVLEEILEPSEGEEPSNARGLLLFGPGGTGKTLLRKAVESAAKWSQIVNWTLNTKTPAVTGPTLIHVEILEKLTANEAIAVRRLFSDDKDLPVPRLVLAEIRDPNDLQDFLRGESCFSDEIEVSIPDARQRLEILQIQARSKFDQAFLEEAASRTHGYTGGDLRRLLTTIHRTLRRRQKDNLQPDSVTTNGESNGIQHDAHHNLITSQSTPTNHLASPTSSDLTLALTTIRPSTLHSIILEKPSIHWSDIGGQDAIKSRLQDAVDWPLRYPTQLREYGITSKKGILLYGPPGCSKTMLVKALATESDYNFLAVKGAELISMYVGESERATRDIFRKARAARPCIIFFDEIDAIARRASGSSELNVLTTLLNEMDGFEELRDVLVVAATNKPQSIDPALLRPGRFDNLVYIGPPDRDTREAILRYRFEKFRFDDEVREGEMVGRFAEMMNGYSGAEVVAITQMAGELALKRDMKPIGKEEIEEAIKLTPRSISREMVREYEDWNAARLAG